MVPKQIDPAIYLLTLIEDLAVDFISVRIRHPSVIQFWTLRWSSWVQPQKQLQLRVTDMRPGQTLFSGGL